mmetsp:Transcript_19682/g.39002  ORF Transcript_19682/g.39002 Transcript_19682/m.39002 type:complete len:112 (+) Transcript_19682:93-428(+)
MVLRAHLSNLPYTPKHKLQPGLSDQLACAVLQCTKLHSKILSLSLSPSDHTTQYSESVLVAVGSCSGFLGFRTLAFCFISFLVLFTAFFFDISILVLSFSFLLFCFFVLPF